MVRNPVGKVAIALILVGAVLLVGPSFGFSSITADRGVAVNVAGPGEGYLGIVDQSETETANIGNQNQYGEPIRLTDNGVSFDSGTPPSVTLAEFDGQSAAFDVSVVEDGGEYAVRVACGDARVGNTAGTMVFDVVVAGEIGVTTTWETETEVEVNCPGGGNGGNNRPPGLYVDTVDPANDGRVEFTIGNSGGEFRITSVSLKDASPATEIGGDQRITITRADGETITATNNPTWPTDGTVVSFGGQGNGLKIPEGATATVDIDHFSLNGAEIDMEEATIELTFYQHQQSGEQQLTVRVPCNAGVSDCTGTNSDVVVDDGDSSGYIDTSGSVRTGVGSEAYSGVDAGGSVTTGAESEVHNGIDAGDVSTGDRSKVTGGIVSSGAVTVGEGAIVHNSIQANNDVVVGDGAKVTGGINASGSVIVGEGTTVENGIQANGAVEINADAKVTGGIDAGGNVTVHDGATVHNGIDAGGHVTFFENVEFTGTVTADDGCVDNSGKDYC